MPNLMESALDRIRHNNRHVAAAGPNEHAFGDGGKVRYW